MLSHQQAGRGHGREETRTATVCRDIGPLQNAHRRPGLAAIGKVESVRVSEGRTRTETRHCIMSRKMSPEDFLKAVRNHWAIENKLHWVLDVRMREDGPRPGESRGGPPPGREHGAPDGRQAVDPAAPPAGGPGAGLSP